MQSTCSSDPDPLLLFTSSSVSTAREQRVRCTELQWLRGIKRSALLEPTANPSTSSQSRHRHTYCHSGHDHLLTHTRVVKMSTLRVQPSRPSPGLSSAISGAPMPMVRSRKEAGMATTPPPGTSWHADHRTHRNKLGWRPPLPQE